MTEIDRDEARTEDTGSANGAWSPIMAVLYDPFFWLGEVIGMRRRRRTLLSELGGRVVEIGAGTGLNVAHYPDAVDELVLTEPNSDMREMLARRVDRIGREARISDAPAECLPFPDASVDTVVATLVLCTVGEPERALREVARVLSPDGQLVFIEHVRARSRFLAACQDGLVRPWRTFGGGCVCNRRTLEVMRGCGFTVAATEAVWHGMPAIVRPLVVGRATYSATSSR